MHFQGFIMDHNEIENIKTKSKKMHKEVCDPTSLVYINLEKALTGFVPKDGICDLVWNAKEKV
jgi:hypothetical protein